MPRAFNDHLLQRQAPKRSSSRGKRVRQKKRKKKPGTPLQEPQALNTPGPPAPATLRGEAAVGSEPRAASSTGAAPGSRAGHPGRRPRAPGMQRGRTVPACPAHPKHRHSPTPAAPARARRWRRPQARALRLRPGSPGERASRRASGAQGACAARRTIPGRRWEAGLRESIAQAAELATGEGVGLCRPGGPAGLGTVRGSTTGELQQPSVRACALQRTRLINRGCLGVGGGEGGVGA